MKLFLSIILVTLVQNVFCTSFFKLGIHRVTSDMRAEFNWFGDCKYEIISGYWSLEENGPRSHCSVMFKGLECNHTLTTFVTNCSSILVTRLRDSPGNPTANSTWLTEPGWSNSTINLQRVEDAIITIITDSEVKDVIGEKPSKSLTEQMKEVNLHILVVVASLILVMMAIVIFATCIRRLCPPCKGPNIEDLDEEVDTYDEDDLLDEILDTQLRMGLHSDQTKIQNGFQLEQPPRTQPIFFSSNWASTFSVPEKSMVGPQNVQYPGSTGNLLTSASDLQVGAESAELGNNVVRFRGNELQLEAVTSSSTQALVDTA